MNLETGDAVKHNWPKNIRNLLARCYLQKYISFQGSAGGLLPCVRRQTTFSDTGNPGDLGLVSHTHQFGALCCTDCLSQSMCGGYFKMTFPFPT